VTIKNGETWEETEIDTSALFIMVGAAPKTDWLPKEVKLDRRGFVRTGNLCEDGASFETSVPGIYAVGDVRAGSVKRVASSVGEGSGVIAEVWQRVNGQV
jgi:thioredoxin reductase (NADPH)